MGAAGANMDWGYKVEQATIDHRSGGAKPTMNSLHAIQVGFDRLFVRVTDAD